VNRDELRKLCDEATRKPTIRGVYTLDMLEYGRITAAARKAIPDLLDTLEAVEKAMMELPPLDWKPDDGYGDYNDYPLKDGRLSSVDSTNSGDVHCHGIAVGEQAVHKKLRAILEGGER